MTNQAALPVTARISRSFQTPRNLPLSNLSALVALRALAPLAFGVCCWRYASLTGYVCDDAASNVLAAIREATVQCWVSSSGYQSCFMGLSPRNVDCS
jgi:hypothetical protein